MHQEEKIGSIVSKSTFTKKSANQMQRGGGNVLALFLSLFVILSFFFYYKNFLKKYQMPSSGMTRLNKLEEDGVPEMSFQDISGKHFSIQEFSGSVVIVSFWASWCDPCVEEFPSFLRLIHHFQGKVKLVAVSADHTKNDLLNFLKAFSVEGKDYSNSLYVVWDKTALISQKFGTEVLPESYIIDSQGKLVRKVVGAENWSQSQAIEYFNSLLK